MIKFKENYLPPPPIGGGGAGGIGWMSIVIEGGGGGGGGGWGNPDGTEIFMLEKRFHQKEAKFDLSPPPPIGGGSGGATGGAGGRGCISIAIEGGGGDGGSGGSLWTGCSVSNVTESWISGEISKKY